MTSSVGTKSTGTTLTRTGNLQPSTYGENLRSIGCQMRSQGQVISVRGQKILRWKLGRGCHFGSNDPIYIFNFIFSYSAFFFIFIYLFFFLFIYFFLVFAYFLYKFFLFLFIYLHLHWQQSISHHAHPTALFNDHYIRQSKNSDLLKIKQSHPKERKGDLKDADMEIGGRENQ